MEIPEKHKKIVLDRIKKSEQKPERMIKWSATKRLLKTEIIGCAIPEKKII